MCGIYCNITKNKPEDTETKRMFDKIKSRGPENHYLKTFKFKEFYLTLGFHRLAIHGQEENANQPFFYPNEESPEFAIVCNGEIYNLDELQGKFMLTRNSESDCEILQSMYKEIRNPPETELLYKLEVTEFLNELDGVYAFLIIDFQSGIIYQGRDPLGVRPMYRNNLTPKGIAFASEGKSIKGVSYQIKNGTLVKYDFNQNTPTQETIAENKINTFSQEVINNRHFLDNTIHTIKSMVSNKLRTAVKKRLSSDREIGVFLSGGLDSSLIAAIAQEESTTQLKSFSIGIIPDDQFSKETSELKEICPDIYFAEKVAESIKTDHTTVKIKESEAINSISEVIRILESNDVTTIRASTGMYLLSKWISENTNVKVLLSGEGSDELFGGYLYFHSAPSKEDFQKETERLLSDIRFFDALRSDRSTACCGLEVRVPFLDKEFVDYVISLDPVHKMPSTNEFELIKDSTRSMEKWLLRSSFHSILPKEVLFRQKDAFSDAVGYNWVNAIRVYCEKQGFTEEEYFQTVFRKHYKKTDIPYKWMPRWQITDDPSARTLHFHQNSI